MWTLHGFHIQTIDVDDDASLIYFPLFPLCSALFGLPWFAWLLLAAWWAALLGFPWLAWWSRCCLSILMVFSRLNWEKNYNIANLSWLSKNKKNSYFCRLKIEENWDEVWKLSAIDGTRKIWVKMWRSARSFISAIFLKKITKMVFLFWSYSRQPIRTFNCYKQENIVVSCDRVQHT